jgi:glycosyltransferase involved in cell wall biosynthesis
MAIDLSLVIPCYNEARHLRESVRALLEVLQSTRYDYEVLFVDDGSRDGTPALLQEICRDEPACRYLLHDRNRGRGAAFKTGFRETTGRVTGFIDIDLEVHALYIPALVNLIDRHGYDVVTGYRYYLLRQTGGLVRNALSHAYRLICKLLLDFGVRDSETGCKFFCRETAGAAVLESDSDGWFWDTEVMARAALMDLRIHEMPVLFLRRADKRSTVRLLPDVYRYLVELAQFRPKVGLSLSSKSPIYWTCVGFDLAMRLLYRAQYRETYAAISELIPDGASVVDVCCGTARLARDGLRGRRVEYLGLDFNGHFVMGVRKRGIHAKFFELLSGPIPSADYVVMCSSFYHAWGEEEVVFAKLAAAAREAVIISEPVENLSSSRTALGRSLGRWLSNPGAGQHDRRFDYESFSGFARRYGAEQVIREPGRRNAIAVFRTARHFQQAPAPMGAAGDPTYGG